MFFNGFSRTGLFTFNSYYFLTRSVRHLSLSLNTSTSKRGNATPAPSNKIEQAEASSAAAESNGRKRKQKLAKSADVSCFTIIYTDGCCIGNGLPRSRSGLGVFWGVGDSRNLSEKLSQKFSTNNRAEIEACCRALEQCVEQGIQAVELRTDSLYVVNSMNSWIHRWKKNGWRGGDGSVKNKSFLLRLDKLRQSIANTKFTHVEGHSGNPNDGNNNADRLAKAGAMKDTIVDHVTDE